MDKLITKATTTVATTAISVNVASADHVHEQANKTTPNVDNGTQGVYIRQIDMSEAVDDVRDLEYDFVERTAWV
jgi:Cu/Ag efflux protein CusF